MQRIVLTTDLSEEATRAFGPTIELARKLGAAVELLHVVEDLQALPHGAPLAPKQSAPSVAAERSAAEKKLREIAGSLGVDVETTVLVAEDVADAIAKHARQHGDAMIAMSTHGRTGWRHLLLGSVAEKVLRHATVPVVTFPRNPEPR